ncbi:MAG: winged helix-turn-helix transcriptional regulator [Candidatus Woesearchaeota archaeon]
MTADIPIRSRRIRSLVGILTEDARLPTKRIASRLRCSQQLVSYLIGRLTNDTDIVFTAQVDTARLGLEHVIVGIRYKRIIPSRIKAAITALRSEPYVTLLVEGSGDVDLLIECSSANLSAFSKQLRLLLADASDIFDVSFVMPIVVRRVYPRSYLNRSKRDVRILFGDRTLERVVDADRLTLMYLQSDARLSLLELSRRTGSSVSAVRSSIARLESSGVLRGSTIRGDIGSVGISTSFLLLRLPSEGFSTIDQVVSRAEAEPHVIEVVKLIGAYHVMLRIEDIPASTVLRSLRMEFDIERSAVFESYRIRLERPLPL